MKPSQKQTILLFTFLLCITSMFSQRVKGNGKMTTVTRTTASYDGVYCGGFMDFELVKGKEGSIIIEGEENLIDYIITEVKDNKLIVKTKKNVNLKTSINKSIKITIPFEEINLVSLTGSGDLWTKDVLDVSDLKVSLTGSGDINLTSKNKTLESHLTGSGDIIFKGSTKNLKVMISGSGDVNASKLISDNTVVAISGSGDVSVVSNESLKAHVSGSGDIEYSGNPKKEETKVAGSGSISKR
ncbi:head GIN domain-containing protein [Corallibacter sp.]|uniref:head GIN domain-containing protein n=1 Tax=Corallibacter sp. TaxID=2038084 RepID=UPI003AB16BDC